MTAPDLSTEQQTMVLPQDALQALREKLYAPENPWRVMLTDHEFNIANDAFYDEPDDLDLNDQGMRRKRLAAAFRAVGIEVLS